MTCEGCGDEAPVDERWCRSCQEEPDPDWEYEARFEREYR